MWALGKAEVYVRDAWLGATNDPSLAGPAGVAPAPTPGPVSDTVMWLHLTTPPVGYTVVTIKTEESAGDGEVGETGAGQSGRQVASEARKHSGGPATSREGKQGRVQDQATLQDCERVRGGAGDGGWVVRNEFFEVSRCADVLRTLWWHGHRARVLRTAACSACPHLMLGANLGVLSTATAHVHGSLAPGHHVRIDWPGLIGGKPGGRHKCGSDARLGVLPGVGGGRRKGAAGGPPCVPACRPRPGGNRVRVGQRVGQRADMVASE